MASLTYEELHGSKNWDGLLDPLNPDLRTLILGYGDLASASERALNNNEGSKYAGYCHYGKSSFFKGSMLPSAESKYDVTSYIYATARVDFPLSFLIHGKSRENSDMESNWMGFVAVSNDEYSKSIGRREIVVVWRGTVRTYEWINDIKDAGPMPADPILPATNGKSITSLIGSAINQPKIMEGWLIIYNTCNPKSPFVNTSARTQLLAQIKDLLVKYKGEKISITVVGHSLGGSLATVSAVDIAANAATPDIKVSAFVFASPQVGNEAFKKRIEELPNLNILSIKNINDIVPKWPSKLMDWVDDNVKIKLVDIPQEVLLYVDVGVDILIDSKKSPFLKEKGGLDILHPFDFHNLEGMLHTVAGYDGKDREFDWKSVEKRRCLPLVNMTADLLKEKYQIPESWWAVKHKGMVLNENGEWVLSPLDRDDHGLSPAAATVIYQV